MDSLAMLTSEERIEFEHEIEHYPNKRAACVEALKIVQKHRRWVPDDALVLERAEVRTFDGQAPRLRERNKARAERAADEGSDGCASWKTIALI